MFSAKFGFVVSKIAKFEEFLAEFASFKAKYQVNGRADRPLSMAGVLDISSSPDENWWEIYPTMWILPRRGIWGIWPLPSSGVTHACYNDDQSPNLFGFPWSSSEEHKSSNTNKKNFRPPSLAVEVLLLFTFDFRVLQVGYPTSAPKSST